MDDSELVEFLLNDDNAFVDHLESTNVSSDNDVEEVIVPKSVTSKQKKSKKRDNRRRKERTSISNMENEEFMEDLDDIMFSSVDNSNNKKVGNSERDNSLPANSLSHLDKLNDKLAKMESKRMSKIEQKEKIKKKEKLEQKDKTEKKEKKEKTGKKAQKKKEKEEIELTKQITKRDPTVKNDILNPDSYVEINDSFHEKFDFSSTNKNVIVSIKILHDDDDSIVESENVFKFKNTELLDLKVSVGADQSPIEKKKNEPRNEEKPDKNIKEENKSKSRSRSKNYKTRKEKKLLRELKLEHENSSSFKFKDPSEVNTTKEKADPDSSSIKRDDDSIKDKNGETRKSSRRRVKTKTTKLPLSEEFNRTEIEF